MRRPARRFTAFRPPADLKREFMAEASAAYDQYGHSDALSEAMRDWVDKQRNTEPRKPNPPRKGALAQFSLLNVRGSQFSA